MTYRGHVRNGQILLDQPTDLPEGAAVTIEVVDRALQTSPAEAKPRRRDFQPIDMPGDSLADELIRDRR